MNVNARKMLPQFSEDYKAYNHHTRTGGNLTPSQQAYADVWRHMKPMQRDGQPWNCMVLGFKGGRTGAGGTHVTLSPEFPIQPANAVRLMGVLPMRAAEAYSEEYLAARADRERRGAHFRLHFFDFGSAVRNGEVSFDFNAANKSYQADASNLPRQDHQRYSSASYKPSAVGELIAEAAHLPLADSLLASPVAGTLTTMRDELFFRILVNGYDIFRFWLQDLPAVEMLKTAGQVEKGETVARLLTAMDFQTADYIDGKPSICWIGGDVMAANRNLDQLHFVTTGLMEMVDFSNAQQDPSIECNCLASLEPAAPRHLVQFPLSVIEERYERGWTPNAAFNNLLCYYLGPEAKATGDGQLSMRAPVNGILMSVVKSEEHWQLTFLDHEERESLLLAPACAVLGEKAAQVFCEGGDADVVENEDMGDYVPRRWYADVAAIAAVAGASGLIKLERVLFDALMLRSGQLNWRGEGACVDRRFISESMMPLATGHWLDMSPLEPFYDPEYKMYRLPPVQYSVAENGFVRYVNQICFDFTPSGPKFGGVAISAAPQESRARTRRGRRRRNRVS